MADKITLISASQVLDVPIKRLIERDRKFGKVIESYLLWSLSVPYGIAFYIKPGGMRIARSRCIKIALWLKPLGFNRVGLYDANGNSFDYYLDDLLLGYSRKEGMFDLLSRREQKKEG